MQGLFASLEDYDLQNTTVPEVDDGDVVEMFEAAQEVGREVEADTAQAQDAMAVVEALENYRELLKRELALGDGVNRTTTRAIEIGVEALTARYRDEDGAPLAWSMESFDTPGQAVRATQASLEGIGDIMSDISAKAKAFAQRAMAGLAKMTRATANFFSSVKGRAQKLRKQVESAEFESKTLKADDYAYICTGGKIDFGASLGNVQKFIDNFVLGDGIVKPMKNLEAEVDKMLDQVTEQTTVKEFGQMLKDLDARLANDVKGGFKDGTMQVTDRLSLELSAGKNFFDVSIQDNKKSIGGEVQSIDKNSAIKSLDSIIAQCQSLESVKWETVYDRIAGNQTVSNESVGEMAKTFGGSLLKSFKKMFKGLILISHYGGLTGGLTALIMLLMGGVLSIKAILIVPIMTYFLGAAISALVGGLLLISFAVPLAALAVLKGGVDVYKLKQIEENQDAIIENGGDIAAVIDNVPMPATETTDDLDPKIRAEADKRAAQVNANITQFIMNAAQYTNTLMRDIYMDGMDYIQDSM